MQTEGLKPELLGEKKMFREGSMQLINKPQVQG